MLNKITKNNFAFFSLLTILGAFLIYLLNKELIDFYIINKYVGGWDGSGHFAIGKYYADNIFPSVWGWIPNWYNGMPFPQFYPPLFYYLLALIHNLTGFDYQNLFKYFLILLSFVTPGITALLYYYRVNKSKFQSLFVLAISVIFISAKSKIGFVGVSLSSLLNNGLATQPLAFIFFLLWLFFFVDISKKPINKYLTGFFLFLVFLSNAHVVLVAFLFFVTIFVTNFLRLEDRSLYKKETRNFVYLYFFSGFIPLVAAGFWYIPMLTYYSYSTSTALGFYWGSLFEIFSQHYYLIIIFALSIYLFKKIKEIIPKTIIITTFTLIILEAIKINELLPDLPLHIDRWFGTIYFLYPILIVYIVWKAKTIIEKRYLYNLIIFIVSILVIYNLVLTGGLRDNLRGIYLDSNLSNITSILEYFREEENKDGLIMVEAHTQYSAPADKVLNTYLGMQGNKTIYTIIRESAISSLFYTPIRNALSFENECWGINCQLSFYDKFLEDDFEKHLSTALDYGINKFLIRSAQQKEEFDESPLVEEVASFQQWKIYESTEERQKATIPEKEPILVISDIETKKDRPVFDYISLVENINVRLHRTDIVFVLAPTSKIDDLDIEDLKKFKNIIVSAYNYDYFDVAAHKMDQLAENSKIIAAYPQDYDEILFNYVDVLSEDNDDVIILEEYLNEAAEENEELEPVVLEGIRYEPQSMDSYEELIKLIDAEIDDTDYDATIEYTELGDTYNSIKINNPTGDRIPVVINQSHFPTWESINDNNIYMASLVNRMIFIENDDSIYFKTPNALSLAHLISIIGILSVLYFLYRDYKRKK